MLSTLPTLLAFQGFSSLLLRLTLGAVFILWSYKKFDRVNLKNNKPLNILQAVLGAFLVVGFMTQIVALISALVLGNKVLEKIKAKAFLTDGVNYYLILFIIAVSLIFSGAGYIAFDLPI